MTGFEVYVIMQLDSVIASAGVLAGVLVFGTLFFVSFNLLVNEDMSVVTKNKALLRKLAYLIGGLLLVNTFLPSTKTAAAMHVLPAIANNETIQNEASEIYQLAKQALKDAVATPEQKDKN